VLCCAAVSYDDGDLEWLDLSKEKFKVLPAAGGPGSSAAAKRRRAARVLADSDDNDEGEEEQEEDDSGADSDFKGVRVQRRSSTVWCGMLCRTMYVYCTFNWWCGRAVVCWACSGLWSQCVGRVKSETS
jgi:hypothetical protein